jgi:arginase
VRQPAIAVRDLGDVRRDGIAECCQAALETVARPGLAGFWLHLDVDVLDDKLMPAVDYRTPDGLTWQEVEHVVAQSLASGRMVGMQVTIYNPTLDEPGAPLAERIVETLAAGLRGAA